MLVARGYNDLSGALRQRLGRSFTSLAPIGFPLVAVLAIAYLFVLGPLDYLLVQRWLRQPLRGLDNISRNRPGIWDGCAGAGQMA